MNTDNSVELQRQLQEVYRQLGDGQPQVALDGLKKMQQDWPNNPTVEHLVALSYKRLGDFSKSKTHFLRSLATDQNQPEVHNNLANLLKLQEQYVDAEGHYLKAIALHPLYLQAQRNLAICYQAKGDYIEAIAAYSKAIALVSTDVSAITGMADCLRLTGDLNAAHDAYQKALLINPLKYKSWHNFGLNFHLQGRLDDAIKCYRKANEISPNKAEIVESLAMALYENGETLKAITLFTSALNTDPGNVQLHERFNSMVWETEFADRFGESYVSAIDRLADSRDVSLSYARMLFQAGRVEHANSILGASELRSSTHHTVLSLRGKIDAELGNYDSAYERLSASIEERFSEDVAQQMVKIDITLGRYTQAQEWLVKMFSNTPNCQLTWALQSLVWRLTDDARYRWLCDYEVLIEVYYLEAPAGYASLDSFLLAIESELKLMHRNEREPLQQTLRNGTQTAARLLDNPSPVLRSLKESLTQIVEKYISGLPSDEDHPFLSRKKSRFEFSGSWSVNLSANGFHVNHVHPEGWISSSCYIALPESMGHSEDLRRPYQGYLKFGESPLQLDDREQVELKIEPKPGMVVLFPSYFWHGTYSFDGEQSDFRLTAPFDVVPR